MLDSSLTLARERRRSRTAEKRLRSRRGYLGYAGSTLVATRCNLRPDCERLGQTRGNNAMGARGQNGAVMTPSSHWAPLLVLEKGALLRHGGFSPVHEQSVGADPRGRQ